MIKVHKERHAQRANGGEETKRELREDHRYLTQITGVTCNVPTSADIFLSESFLLMKE